VARGNDVSARDVIANLRALAARTSDANGAQRIAWGPVWRDARRWLDGVLAEAGLRAESDLAGNNWITVPGARADTVIIGGHLDSVPNGGWLDGPLGVLAGIELRRFTGITPPVTLAVVDFADEEGGAFLAQPAGVVWCERQSRARERARPDGPSGRAACGSVGRKRRRCEPHAGGAPSS
jgi:hypothetical protein